MLRRVGEADRRAMVTLLAQAPQLNLYLLGNLESPGFDADYCEFWGDFDEAGRLRAVVNRYMNGWTLYGATDADWPRIGALMDDYPLSMERLQDNPGGVPSVLPYVQRYVAASVVEAEIMTLAAADFRPIPPPDGVEVRRATLVDLPQLITLYADAGSMRRAPAAVERPLRDRRVWVAVVEGVVASAALTNAETQDAAMIGGVYTPPAWRNRGLSQAVCSALCAELLALPKLPALYWENPTAGRVYGRLGFVPNGVWRSVRLQPR